MANPRPDKLGDASRTVMDQAWRAMQAAAQASLAAGRDDEETARVYLARTEELLEDALRKTRSTKPK